VTGVKTGQGGVQGGGVGGSKAGRGRGPSTGPEERTKVDLQKNTVSGRPRGGVTVGEMLDDGDMVAGEASAKYVEAVQSSQQKASDAIRKQEIPSDYQGLIRDYFESLRKAGK
jgi:hypothetical protein